MSYFSVKTYHVDNCLTCLCLTVLIKALHTLSGLHKAKQSLQTCAKCEDSDHPAQSIIHTCAPLIPSIIFNDSVTGQWRSWSDCSDVQADLGLCCPHMPKDAFLHDMTNMTPYHCGQQVSNLSQDINQNHNFGVKQVIQGSCKKFCH